MTVEKIETFRTGKIHFSDGAKRQIIEEYLRSECTKMDIERRHGIKKHGAILSWMKLFGYSESEKGILALSKEPKVAKKNTPKDSKTQELEAKIKLLEKQLEDERLRTEMLNRMVDLAEKTYKIPVRKNSNTK